jgi:hypothetical protein
VIKVIVTTTINPPSRALKLFSEKKDWTLIVVGDKITPHNLFRRFEKKCKNVLYLSPDDQEKKYPKLSKAIGWRKIQRRNIGYLEAYEMGASVIATVDDDNIPTSEWGKNLFLDKNVSVNYYKTRLNSFDPVGATNYPNLWHRGYPLQLITKRSYSDKIKKNIKSDIQADFWNGDPDIDAVCRLTFAPDCAFKHKYFPISSNRISPFNSQNTFLTREVLKHYFLYPDIGRMDDIRIYNRPLNDNEVATLASAISSGQFIVSVAKGGNGIGVVSGGGIGCGKHCAESYVPGTSVTLTATPSFGSTFTGWSGACSGVGVCTLNVNSTKYVIANFTLTTTPVANIEAESGTLTAPMILAGNAIYQYVQTGIATAGKATYTFNVPQAGDYFIVAKVNAPSQANNSYYINIDGDPTGETMAWFMNTTGGFENRFVSWGGVDTGGNPVKLFTLTPGQHTLVIKGREDGVYLDKLIVYYNGIIGNVPPPITPDDKPEIMLLKQDVKPGSEFKADMIKS